MTPEQRRQVTKLIESWYQDLAASGENAARAAANLAALANAHPDEYDALALKALEQSGFIGAETDGATGALGREEWTRRYLAYLKQNLAELDGDGSGSSASAAPYDDLILDFPHNPEAAAKEEIESLAAGRQRFSELHH